LYVWNVPNTLPSGDDYYIRLQTGTSDDWDGGRDTSPPASGAVYGTSGYFSLNTTTAAAAAATVIATQFVTCCSSSNSNAGIIAGSVIGGVIGLAFLLGVLGYTFMPTVTIQTVFMFLAVFELLFLATASWRRQSHIWLLVPAAIATCITREGRLRPCSSNVTFYTYIALYLLTSHLSQLTLTLVPEGFPTEKTDVIAWQVILANYSEA
jgi:hypothetical protein